MRSAKLTHFSKPPLDGGYKPEITLVESYLRVNSRYVLWQETRA